MLLEIAAIIVVLYTGKPVRWLILLAAAGEFMTTWPFGVTTALIFLPLLIKRAIQR